MNDFSNFAIYKILSIIKFNLSIDELLSIGYDYSQISLLISQVLHLDLAQYDEKFKITLSQEGEEFLNQYLGKNKENKIQILPLDNVKLERKLDIFDIYLPIK